VTGLLILGGLVAAVGAALWWFGRVRGAALQLSLAALMLGGAGYALQGRPSLAGAPQRAATGSAPLSLREPRHLFFGEFSGSERWMIISESLASRGNMREAAGAIRAGLKLQPRDAALWTGLGNALVDHAGMLTPAAVLAFDRAEALAPKHPGPLFFRGLALARSGKRDEALAVWRQALTLSSQTAAYRPIIEGGIATLGDPALQSLSTPSG
jgi:tetratricopeptide (TPR) repeat protein